ncbi:MAG: chemotaxis protein CheW [Candidatus Loosdrechtia sp.]|uniref:chemotaxis protein CheW n=1 Tax=Candidatus Loosdrechtia sp. TaxID=3101272 RepID=UPI003A6A10F6|nr:MAG: chemotaxis protein CheW [Candidatus Jettenia sp. AMX2]
MNGSIQLVVFKLDAMKFGVLLSFVERVVPVTEVTGLPGAPEIVLGIINMKGKIIPVVNIRKRFRLPVREIELSDRFIISRTSKRCLAIIADEVDGVAEYPEQKIITAANILPNLEYIEGVIKTEDGMVLIHDLEKFLSLDEVSALDKAMIPVSE